MRCPRCSRWMDCCYCSESQLRSAKAAHWLDPMPRRWDTERRFEDAIQEKRRQRLAEERREVEAHEARREAQAREEAARREAYIRDQVESERDLITRQECEEAIFDPEHGANTGL